MPKRSAKIPVNAMADSLGSGIAIERVVFKDLIQSAPAGEILTDDGTSAHRHDGHSFFFLESGTVNIDIDFEHYEIRPSSVIYIHPNQVHQTISTENMVVSYLAITNENLNPEYLTLLEDLAPAKPLVLDAETFLLLSETVSLCLNLAGRKADKLYHALLKDSCNTLVGLVLSQYLASAKSPDKYTRFEVVYKNFRRLLEKDYTIAKRPAYYAEMLNISIPYLNECITTVTGQPVTYHIQQRVMLEAKRMLYHSDRSVKEIAAALGYDDYPYFSRLFAKIVGSPALAFRKKNLD